MEWIRSKHHQLHNPALEIWAGTPLEATETPDRAETIAVRLASDVRFTEMDATSHGLEPVLRVHDSAMVAWFEACYEECAPWVETREIFPDTMLHPGLLMGGKRGPEPMDAPLGRLGYWCFDTMTPIVPGTYQAALGAVDTALSAYDLVARRGGTAYALCRPPGHHAARSMIGGFCYLNNAAIVAAAMRHDGAERVAILDVDYHHGNGTQAIFYEDADVHYVSTHADPMRAFPYFAGYANETGLGKGEGANLNLPLPKGATDELFLGAVRTGIEAITHRGAEQLVISLGVDTYELDPLSDLCVSRSAFHEVGKLIGELGLPTVVVQEGGYDTEDLGINVANVLLGIEGENPLTADTVRDASSKIARHV